MDLKDISKLGVAAVAAREHMLLIGPPGCGKSQFSRELYETLIADDKQDEVLWFGAGTNGHKRFVPIHFSKYSDETLIYGPIDVSEFMPKEAGKKSNLVYNTDNSIITANFALIDEIFDASPHLLRCLLEIIHERSVSRGPFQAQCNLESCTATSNYLPEEASREVEAVLDRFLIQLPMHVPSMDEIFAAMTKKEIKIFQRPAKNLSRIVQKTREIYNKIFATADDKRVLMEVFTEIHTKSAGAGDISPRRAHKIMRFVGHLGAMELAIEGATPSAQTTAAIKSKLKSYLKDPVFIEALMGTIFSTFGDADKNKSTPVELMVQALTNPIVPKKSGDDFEDSDEYRSRLLNRIRLSKTFFEVNKGKMTQATQKKLSDYIETSTREILGS